MFIVTATLSTIIRHHPPLNTRRLCRGWACNRLFLDAAERWEGWMYYYIVFKSDSSLSELYRIQRILEVNVPLQTQKSAFMHHEIMCVKHCISFFFATFCQKKDQPEMTGSNGTERSICPRDRDRRRNFVCLLLLFFFKKSGWSKDRSGFSSVPWIVTNPVGYLVSGGKIRSECRQTQYFLIRL